jgi:DNA primase
MTQTKLSLRELENYRNQYQGKPSGKYVRYYCPIHGGDNQRSLQVNPETGHFRCFSCGAYGYLEENKQAWLLNNKKDYSNNSQKFSPRGISAKTNKTPTKIAELKSTAKTVNPIFRKELIPILQDLQNLLPGSKGEAYLQKRKIPLAIAKQYGLGFAENGKWPHLKDGRPVRQSTWGRVVFPHTNPQGEIVNLYGRAVEIAPVAKDMKHDHLPGAKGVFNAQALSSSTVFICEGAFNAISLITAGYKNACAIFGVDGLRWEWIQASKIVFCLDSDSTGIKKQQELSWQAVLRGYQVFFLDQTIYGSFKDLNEVFTHTGKLDIGDWIDKHILSNKIETPPETDWQQKLATYPAHILEFWHERVGIRIFDGGLTKEQAEKLAFEDVQKLMENNGK